jgi:hypothetical protein
MYPVPPTGKIQHGMLEFITNNGRNLWKEGAKGLEEIDPSKALTGKKNFRMGVLYNCWHCVCI